MKLLNQLRKAPKEAGLSNVSKDTELVAVSPEAYQSKEAIQAWLVSQLAGRLGIESAKIEVQKDFPDYGLNSIEAVNLSGELENYLERRLSPTLIWDYPNIEALAEYLAEDTSKDAAPEAPATEVEPEEARKILTKLDGMAEEEVDRLLDTMLSAKEGANE